MRFGSQIRSLIPWSSFHTDGNESEEVGEAPSRCRSKITERTQDVAAFDFFLSPKFELTIISRFLLSRVSEIQVLHGGDS